MRCRLLILVVALFLFIPTEARPSFVDSLKNELRLEQSDTAKYRILVSLAEAYRDSNYTNALDYYKQSLEVIERTKYKSLTAKSYQRIGNFYMMRGEFDIALENLNNALSIYETIGNKEEIAGVLNDIGLIYKNRGKYDMAATKFVQALRIYESINDIEGISIVSNNIGQVLYYKNDFKGSIEYFKQYFEVNSVLQKPYAVAAAANNIASAYLELTDFNKAIEYFFISLKIYDSIDVPIGKAIIQDNLGSLYYDIMQYDEALNYHKRALKIFEAMQSPKRISATKVNLAKVYLKKNKLTEAVSELNQALAIIDPLGNTEEARDVYHILAEAYQKTSNYERAYEYLTKYHQIKDSIINVETLQNIEQLKAQYEAEKRDKILENAQNKLDTQRWIIFGFGSVFVVLAVLIGIAISRYVKVVQKVHRLSRFSNECVNKIPRLVNFSAQQLVFSKNSPFSDTWNIKPDNLKTPKFFINCVRMTDFHLAYVLQLNSERVTPELISLAIYDFLLKHNDISNTETLLDLMLKNLDNDPVMLGIKSTIDYSLYPVIFSNGRLYSMAGLHLQLYNNRQISSPENNSWVELNQNSIVYLISSQGFEMKTEETDDFIKLFGTLVQYNFEKQNEIAMNMLNTIDMERLVLIYALKV